jgi:hypothetical protein
VSPSSAARALVRVTGARVPFARTREQQVAACQVGVGQGVEVILFGEQEHGGDALVFIPSNAARTPAKSVPTFANTGLHPLGGMPASA